MNQLFPRDKPFPYYSTYSQSLLPILYSLSLVKTFILIVVKMPENFFMLCSLSLRSEGSVVSHLSENETDV